MQRLLFVGMLLASLAAAPAARAGNVCSYNVRFVIGTFCPVHTGDVVCLSQNATSATAKRGSRATAATGSSARRRSSR